MRENPAAAEKNKLPGNAYFLPDQSVLCMPRGDGEARYPYSHDGFNLWAGASGTMYAKDVYKRQLYTLKSPEKFMQMFDDILNVWLYRSFGYKLKTKMLLYDILRNMLMEHMIQGNMLHSYNTIQAAMQFICLLYTSRCV